MTREGEDALWRQVFTVRVAHQGLDVARRVGGVPLEGEAAPRDFERLLAYRGDGPARPAGDREAQRAEDMTETEPSSRPVGYARVSSYGQTLDAQLEQLRAAGCAKLYREKASGAQADRRELQRMLKVEAGSSAPWPNRGPTPRPAPGG